MFSDDLFIPASLDTSFNVGMYQIVINDVVLFGVAKVVVIQETDFRRLICYDKEGYLWLL